MPRVQRIELLALAAPPTAETLRFGMEAADPKSLARFEVAGRRLHPYSTMFRSPSAAAAQTAVALGQGGAAVEQDLRDRNYGQWSGLTLDAVAAQSPDALAHWLEDPDVASPDGESVASLVQRAEQWLGRAEADHIVAVTHPPVVRACVVAALACPPTAWFRIDIGYATRTTIAQNGTKWRVQLVNGPL